MPEMKYEKKESLSRREAARRLSKIASALAADGAFELKQGAEKLELDVAEKVTLEFEIEVGDDCSEIEIELKWSPASKSAAADDPAAAEKPTAAAKQPAASGKPAAAAKAKARRKRAARGA